MTRRILILAALLALTACANPPYKPQPHNWWAGTATDALAAAVQALIP